MQGPSSRGPGMPGPYKQPGNRNRCAQGGSGEHPNLKRRKARRRYERTVILRPFSRRAFRLPLWGSWGRAAPKSRVPLGGAQRAPPVCCANTLLRLIAPQGQSLCAPQFRYAQLWPHAHNPAPRRNSGNFLWLFLLLAKERTTSREAAVPGLPQT